SPPREVLERGEFVEPLERLREQGKVRYWGVACEHADDVQPSLRHQPLASIQVGLSALEQAALDAAIPAAAARGVAIIARQVYASGLLTRPLEKLQPDQIDSEPRVADRKRQQLEAYAAIAAQSGRSRVELALKFALAQPDVAVALLGISRAEHLEAGLNALQAPDLTDQERQLLLASRRPGR
ncbi:MAG TPA: aldo/keto reductase, partial [Chloroflexota bacterium]